MSGGDSRRPRPGKRVPWWEIDESKPPPSYVVEIPPEIWKVVLEQDQARRLAESAKENATKFEECPYNRHHRVPFAKFTQHLQNCRTNYKRARLAKGEQVYTLSCKYNYRHEVPHRELLHHEDRCEDRHKIPFYMLYFNPYFEDDEKTKLQYNLEDFKIPQEELDKMYDGLYLNQYIGGGTAEYMPPTPLSDIRRKMEAERKAMKEMKKGQNKMMMQPMYPIKPIVGPSSLMPVDFVDTKEKPKPVVPDEGAAGGAAAVAGNGMIRTQADADKEEEEYWSKDSGQRWDFYEASRNPQAPLLKYPMGLTKEQRREFVKWNTEWMGMILAHQKEQEKAKEVLDNVGSIKIGGRRK